MEFKRCRSGSRGKLVRSGEDQVWAWSIEKPDVVLKNCGVIGPREGFDRGWNVGNCGKEGGMLHKIEQQRERGTYKWWGVAASEMKNNSPRWYGQRGS